MDTLCCTPRCCSVHNRSSIKGTRHIAGLRRAEPLAVTTITDAAVLSSIIIMINMNIGVLCVCVYVFPCKCDVKQANRRLNARAAAAVLIKSFAYYCQHIAQPPPSRHHHRTKSTTRQRPARSRGTQRQTLCRRGTDFMFCRVIK